MKFVLATGNLHKYEEFRRILEPIGITVVLPKEIGIGFDVEETGETFEENAMLKAHAVAEASGLASIADDSGLEVDALSGAPGVYSARYAGEGATDLDRINKLLGELGGVPEPERGARFVSAIACAFPDGQDFTVRGECSGSMAFEPAGAGGFGYDPVFLVRGLGKTFAELTPGEKDAVSHRGIALRKLRDRLSAELNRPAE